jgi:non-canonical purine NTP pyrophosphatase (RdgB/HAM1 family)
MVERSLRPEGMIAFVTGNTGKVHEAERILGVSLKQVTLDLEEIQEIAVEPVVRKKALQAYAVLREPVLVEDTGFYIQAWNGLPGALIKWFLKALGTEGICRLMQGEKNRTVTAVTSFGYYDGSRYHGFTGEVVGVIPQTPRGAGGFGWDPIFQPLSSEKTFAEMRPEEKDRISMRRQALEKLRAASLF